jgi:hypothetical protein
MGLNPYLRCEATLRLRRGKNNRCLWETYQAQKYSARVKRTAYLMLRQIVQIITTKRLTVNVHEEIYGLQETLDWIKNIYLQRNLLRFGCTHSVVTHGCDAERSFHKMARLELNTNKKCSFLQ